MAKGNLHTLDFIRIKDAERAAATARFVDPTTSSPNALAQKLSTPTTTAIPGTTVLASSKAGAGAQAAADLGAGKGGKGRLMTPEEKKRVVEALTRAKTAEEVRRLERMLAEGLVPEGSAPEEIVNGNGVSIEA